MAFGSAVMALMLGSFVWFASLRFVPSDKALELLPFRYVWYFTGAMAALGFALAENFVVGIFGFLIEAIFGASGDKK